MKHEELVAHKNILLDKINEISRTIEYFKSIEITSLISTLENTRDNLIQAVYIINTELYAEEEDQNDKTN